MADKTILIDGEQFTITAPYVEGHQINAAEAKSLNQTRAENIGNNFRKQVKEAKEKGESLDAVRTALAEYDASYVFTLGGVTRVAVDPVEREARKIALAAIKNKLAKEGRSIKDVDEAKLEAAVEKVMLQDDVIKLAKQRVAQAKKVQDIELGEGLVSA